MLCLHTHNVLSLSTSAPGSNIIPAIFQRKTKMIVKPVMLLIRQSLEESRIADIHKNGICITSTQRRIIVNTKAI